MARVGKCGYCKKELREDEYISVYDWPHQHWFKSCSPCHDAKLEDGTIQKCKIKTNSKGEVIMNGVE